MTTLGAGALIHSTVSPISDIVVLSNTTIDAGSSNAAIFAPQNSSWATMDSIFDSRGGNIYGVTITTPTQRYLSSGSANMATFLANTGSGRDRGYAASVVIAT